MDGKVNFKGATYELPGFKSKLEALMKTTPDQPILLKAGKTVPYDKFKAALEVCQSVQVKNLTVIAPPPTPEPAAAATTTVPAPPIQPPQPVAPSNSTEAPAPHLAAPANSSGDMVPIEIGLLPDGTVDFLGETISTDELKSRLIDLARDNPDQLLVITRNGDVTRAQLNKVIAICHGVKLRPKVLKAGEEPSTQAVPAASTTPTANLPAPGLLMHPSLEPMPGNAPPEAPSAPPTTNAPPPAGP
jgi:biopolymer transport protein ExbD